MTRNGAFLGFIAAAFIVILLSGCAIFSGDPDVTTPKEDEAAFSPNVEDEAVIIPMQEEEAPSAEDESFLEDEEILPGDIEERRDLRQQRVNALVSHFIEEGKSLMEKGSTEEAQEQFAHALELDPGNAEARDLFNRLGAMLGQRSESVAVIAAEVRDRIVVKRAQNRIKAEELMKMGDAAMDAQDYEKAIRNYEDALLIVRWNPYLDEGVLDESSLLGRLETAKNELDRQRREQEAELQARIFKQQQEEEQKERELLESKIARLFHDANNAFLNDRYKECELYLEELLKIDPNNEMALELRSLSMRTRHNVTQASLRKDYKKQWRSTFDDLEYDDLPQLDYLQFPSEEEWEQISMRGRSELVGPEMARSPEDEAILRKLTTTPVAADFEQATLEEVIEYFKATTGVSFIISQTIIDSGEEPLFDLVTPPKPALDQLELLLNNSLPPLKYKIQNGVVWILSQEDPTGEYLLDVYDIRDLSKIIANFPAKDFNLTPSKAALEDWGEEYDEDEAPEIIAADSLIDLIRTNIEPSSWEDAENNISPIGNFLVVRQSKKVHDKINHLLQDLRSSAGVLINIESRFITVEDNFLEDIGVDWRGLDGNINDTANPKAAVPNVLLDDFGDGSVPGGYGSESDPDGLGTGNEAGIYYDDGSDGDLMGRLENLLDIQLGEDETLDNSGGTTMQFTFLDDVQMEAILRAVTKSSTSNIIQAPSLTVYNGERANIALLTHFSYVKDFEPEIAQSAVIAEPIVAVARDGIILDVRPVVSSDRRFITMELRPTVALLKRDEDGNLPTFTTGLGVGESVTIELPELEIKRLRTTVTMPDGSTLLLGGMKISNEEKFDTGLPFFKHIPIVSFFLSRKSEYQSKRKLLILVTANIIIPEETEPKTGINK